jgi:hypothetical protein
MLHCNPPPHVPTPTPPPLHPSPPPWVSALQTTLLDPELSRKVQIGASKVKQRPPGEVTSAIESFDVEALGGYEVVKALLTMNCYEQVTISQVKGAWRVV